MNHAIKGGRHWERRVRGQDVRRRRSAGRQREGRDGQDGVEDGGRPREGAHRGDTYFKTGIVNARKCTQS